MTTWWQAVASLRQDREAGVLVTVTDVRGHAPREAGAKMVVSARRTWGSVGGGNLEAEAVRRARALLESRRHPPRVVRQPPLGQGCRSSTACSAAAARSPCCSSRCPSSRAWRSSASATSASSSPASWPATTSTCTWSTPAPSTWTPRRSSPLADAVAAVHVHPVPVLPELVLAELPPGTHVLVMTHDHAEDVALVDAAVRLDHLGPIGLIGSSAKWARFRSRLLADGHAQDVVDRVHTPIGLPGVTTSKEPAAIAVAVAAGLLAAFEREAARHTVTLFRGTFIDTPQSPFRGHHLRAEADAALLVRDGVIAARGPADELLREHPDDEVVDLREGLVLPGFVDTHVHYPQVRAIGGLGMPLLDWLERCALPEEARLADTAYAAGVAADFVDGLARAGTTTALVFGSHFATAVDALFTEADRVGLRVTSGLVLSDRILREDLFTDPDRAYAEGRALADKWHGRRAAPGTPSRRASRSPAPTRCWRRPGPCCATSPARSSPRTSTRTPRRSAACATCSAATTRRATPSTACSARGRCSRTTCTRTRASCGCSAAAARRSRTARPATPPSAAGCSRSARTWRSASGSRSARTSARAPASRCSRRACRRTSPSSCSAARATA